MPPTIITDAELLNQTAELLEATMTVAGHVGLDLRLGAFDGDADARAQAESFLTDARIFCGDLLSAWPESIAL